MFLVEEYLIADEKINIEYKGNVNPIFDNNIDEGKILNQRLELKYKNK